MKTSDLNRPPNPAREARLRPLASHRKVHAQAAQVAADWPAPAEALAIGRGQWPYGSGEGFQLRRDAADHQELAGLVVQALQEQIKAPVQLLSLKVTRATGAVEGLFIANKQRFSYLIHGQQVTYRPADQSRQDATSARLSALEEEQERAGLAEREASAELQLQRTRAAAARKLRQAAELRAQLGGWSPARLDGYLAVSSRLDRAERWG